MARKKRGFGQVRRLPSKRWQAFYTGPDTALHYAPSTFDTRLDAEAWLTDERRIVAAGTWTPPKGRHDAWRGPRTFGWYAEGWLRRRDLKPRTREHYATLLRDFLLPRFEDAPLAAITPADVADWHHDLGTLTGLTYRAHAYALMRAITRTAAAEDLITASPCRVRGAGTVRRAKQIQPATLAELEALALAMPARFRAMVLLASWCALRFGELAELRRKDVDLKNGLIRVRRGVVRTEAGKVIDDPKTAAGSRDVAIPPHLVPVLRDHVNEHAQWGREGLLFPSQAGTNLAQSTLARHWYRARDAAGRPDLRFHDLRHTGATLAAQTGATLAELMGRLGHSTPGAALRYQHATQDRDKEIASRLSAMAARDTSESS